jgi:hypothetical protein
MKKSFYKIVFDFVFLQLYDQYGRAGRQTIPECSSQDLGRQDKRRKTKVPILLPQAEVGRLARRKRKER